jgi:hypothetical protein
MSCVQSAGATRRWCRNDPVLKRTITMALSAKINALGTTDKDGNAKKGTLSVYGLNARFPMSLYANQWRELATVMPSILKLCEQGIKDGTLAGERAPDVTGGGTRVQLAAFTPKG